MNTEDKRKIVADLHERFARSKIVILTDYKGLNVESMNALRRKLREVDVEYQVAKNTLLTKAAQETDVAVMSDYFTGPSAIALNYSDPAAAAKALTQFAKDNKKLELKVGVMEGKVLNADQLKALADLPSRDVLLAQVLSAMNGVPTALVRALNDVPVRLLNVLQAIKDQKAAA